MCVNWEEEDEEDERELEHMTSVSTLRIAKERGTYIFFNFVSLMFTICFFLLLHRVIESGSLDTKSSMTFTTLTDASRMGRLGTPRPRTS